VKTSDTVLLSAAGVVVAAITVLLLSAGRIARGPEKVSSEGQAASGVDTANTTVLTPDLGPFSVVSTQGLWIVRVTGGTAHAVRASFPRELESVVTLSKHGDTLECILADSGGLATRNVTSAPVIEITAPALSGVVSRGMSEVTMERIHCPELHLDADGAFTLRGTDLTTESLVCRLAGMSKVSIEGGVRQADVVAEGGGSIALPMRGGDLTGRLAGSVKLTATGSVARSDVKTEGVATVKITP
jgi:hypothetical protein